MCVNNTYGSFSTHWTIKSLPAELFDGADINDSVVKMVHELWHVLVQEPFVCMHRVPWRRNNKT